MASIYDDRRYVDFNASRERNGLNSLPHERFQNVRASAENLAGEKSFRPVGGTVDDAIKAQTGQPVTTTVSLPKPGGLPYPKPLGEGTTAKILNTRNALVDQVGNIAQQSGQSMLNQLPTLRGVASNIAGKILTDAATSAATNIKDFATEYPQAFKGKALEIGGNLLGKAGNNFSESVGNVRALQKQEGLPGMLAGVGGEALKFGDSVLGAMFNGNGTQFKDSVESAQPSNQTTASQVATPQVDPTTRAWGERSIANIQEGERNRIEAREKMQNLITDRQARAQGDLDARASQQAQHQAWLDRPVDSMQSGSSVYNQGPNGAILKNGQLGQIKTLTAPPGYDPQAELTHRLAMHETRSNPYWLDGASPKTRADYNVNAVAAREKYLAGRASNEADKMTDATNRYKIDTEAEVRANDRLDKAAQFEKEYGQKERQLLSEDEYHKGMVGARNASYAQQVAKETAEQARQTQQDRGAHEDRSHAMFKELYGGHRDDATGKEDSVYATNQANDMADLIATYSDKIQGVGLGNYANGFSKNQAIRLKNIADTAEGQARKILGDSMLIGDPSSQQVKAKKQELFLQQLLDMAPKDDLPTDAQ